MEDLHPVGDLLVEYQQAVEGVDPNATVGVPWNDLIVKDNLGKLGVGASQERITKATVLQVPALDHAVLQAGFVGSVKDLLAQLAPKPEGRRLNRDLRAELAFYAMIPPEHLKGATLAPKSGRPYQGYYYGGSFFPFS